jgi:hypothetical protein
MSFLKKSNQTLANLNAYLAEKGLLVGAVRRVVHDPEQDRMNVRDPRAFAHVRAEPDEIYASEALEHVSERVRTAIILHEMVHLGLEKGRRGGNECEVDVDAWIILHLPEARYGYDTIEYIGPDKRIVIAKNLQVVAVPFAEKVAGAA